MRGCKRVAASFVDLEGGDVNVKAQETLNVLWKRLPSAVLSMQGQMLETDPESAFRWPSN
jgi:hypothetical protein